ncbi:17-beta-hydroxysteroid dehydrogenase type 6-like isoform X1 [Hemicordylus capensis]|uniref:17-beta-hydroxysteroid dehydrogenase type 6-like isoform X1 n=2 Tax=Hemicordylus capensis TaxID=884348 RepID=UPI0023025D00|nr:17-beta-hydroxysteroid dehydrogenase type 6-like isoform X1 [Hemicordylus capensis]
MKVIILKLLAMWLYLAALVGLYFLRRWYRERQTVDNLTERYVFITGCDSGFGNQLARQLDIQGMRVLAACFTQKGAEQLEKATSERLKTTILDVTSTESVEAATTWVKGCVGNKGLWGLVNNAGIGSPAAPDDWLTKDDFAKVINVNLLGVIDVTLHMLPLVKKARGRVVNVASVMGRLACFGGGYCPAKYGVEAFSDNLRRQLHHFGVWVSIVEPGTFITDIAKIAVEDFKNIWSQVPCNIKESYGQQYFETLYRFFQQMIKKGSHNICLVTNCMEHALTSCHPRTRYSAGWDAKLFYIPLSYCPTSVADYVLTCFMSKPAQAL